MKTAKLGAAATTQYWYNALGQRIKKTGPLGTTIFMYDETGHILGEYTAAGTMVQETVWLGDIPIATLRPTTGTAAVYYIHTDQLGTPRKITNNNSSLTLRWSWDPTPFGEGAANESPTGLTAFKYNLRFPGQYFDAESNLNYNYRRDYDPTVGRYVQSDPIGLDGGVNTYAYALGNPAGFFDRDGLATCWYSISKHTVVCDSDDRSRAGMIGPEGVFSGRDGCRNNPDCAGDKDLGPVPPGTYEMVPTDHYGGSYWLKEGFFARQSCKMGVSVLPRPS